MTRNESTKKNFRQDAMEKGGLPESKHMALASGSKNKTLRVTGCQRISVLFVVIFRLLFSCGCPVFKSQGHKGVCHRSRDLAEFPVARP